MALIKCTECGYEMSEFADKCPKCGCPTKIILENLKKIQVEIIPESNASTNDSEPSTPSSDLVGTSTQKQNTNFIPTFLRNKWIIASLGVVVSVILFFIFFSKPSIADISIDKVTPELKKAVQKYDKLDDFSEGLAAVCKDDKWGFIDKLGKEIIPCKYDEVSEFKFGVSVVKKNEKEGIINIYGESIVPIKYDWIDSFSSSDSLTRASLDNNQGIINLEGKVIIPFEYEEAFNVSEGLFLVRKNGVYGCVDKSNQIIIPFEYEGGDEKGFSEGLIAMEKDGNYGYLDKYGKIVIPFDEKYTGDQFSCGFATMSNNPYKLDPNKGLIETESFKMAFINKKGEQVTDFFEGEIHGFCDGYSVVKDGRTNREGLIDTNGNFIIQPEYWLISYNVSDGLVWVAYDTDKSGFVSVKDGHVVIPCEYNHASYGMKFSDGLWAVKNNGKCGFINMSNQLVIQYIYDTADEFNEGFAVVSKYGKYGYVDRYGTDTFN